MVQTEGFLHSHPLLKSFLYTMKLLQSLKAVFWTAVDQTRVKQKLDVITRAHFKIASGLHEQSLWNKERAETKVL